MKHLHHLLFAGLCLATLAAHALQITTFSPQGEAAQIRQVVARFDSPAVRLGDSQAAAPLTVQCSDAQASEGRGRWNNEREWVFDFAADLPPGVRCTARPVLGFKSPSKALLKSASSYQFNSGGPFVKRIQPAGYEDIDEEQYFVLELSGAATAQSVQEHLWCASENVGERIPVRAIEGAERSHLLRALKLEKRADSAPLQWVTLTCARRLTAGTKVQLMVDPGLTTPSGVRNAESQGFEFTVRKPFTAELSCERENAQADCLPIRPLRLHFSAPVERKLALGVRLKSAQETLKPRLDDSTDAEPTAWQTGQALVSSLEFAAPLSARSRYQLELPPDLRDATGRSLTNAASFPLTVLTGDLPPLAKFAASPFGIIERFAEGPPQANPTALLPVTLRKVEIPLAVQGLHVPTQAPSPTPPPAHKPKAGTKVSTLQARDDADIIAWLQRVQTYDNYVVERAQARRDTTGPLPPPVDEQERDTVQTRTLSLLAGRKNAQTLEIKPPEKTGATRPFEVVGIPLPPGFHVVEIASPLLGQSLLDERLGPTRNMYVRTSALVTNLAVHFKLGRENALAWVTTLDRGQSVAGAQVRVSDCNGKTLAQAQTDDQGLARFTGLSAQAPQCKEPAAWRHAYFVSARAHNEGADDLAFTWSDWQRGIEPWRFNLPTSDAPQPDQIAHTIFDRTLLRAGETVSMKHLVRTQTAGGFALPHKPPATLVITHVGSGQSYTQPLAWRRTGRGGLSAASSFQIPPQAKLGQYDVALRLGESDGDGSTDLASGSFRVEEFRLPVFQGSIAPSDKNPLVRPRSVQADVQVHYSAGGGASHLPVRVSALVRDKALDYRPYEAFSFQPPRTRTAQGAASSAPEPEEDSALTDHGRVVADKLPLTLDQHGNGRIAVAHLPTQRRAQELLLEASYADPNGEIQTVRSTHTLWPAAVVAGVKTEDWGSSGTRVRWQALALSPQGQPLAGVPLAVQAIAHSTTSTRKRLVGGFYSYDNQTHHKDLGTLCTGSSDARGLLLCEATIDVAGEVELVVTARDKDGNEAQAAATVWVTRHNELWFGGQDHDRIDLLPEKTSYQPGETAVFQVRMPFRAASALVTVEREGILFSEVVALQGKDPTVRLKVQEGWGPNVYVSALVLRGRLRDVPWYSFFTWGYKAPRQWWSAFWYEGKEYQAPTALVDLSKPAYRLGAAEIRVGLQAHQLKVQVQADRESYPVRAKAQVLISAHLPNGQPAAGAEVALAAVDHALLELQPNRSWQLLEAMFARRSWGVATSTAHMEIVGRRHYGKKAVPAGGGGGQAPTRELFDTLLWWQPAIVLDAQGQARISIPLNDTLGRFDIVAVADAGLALFGTASTSVRSTQDLQIVSSLPPLVREGDQFHAPLVLRNTTQQPMQVEVTARATGLSLAPQRVDIAPGAAREVGWDVTAPTALGSSRAQALQWDIAARDSTSGTRDALKISQRIVPAIPVTVQQATLVQLDDAPWTLELAPPAHAVAGRGGIKLALQPQLALGLPGVRDWWAAYPYTCLEQKTSKAIGLGDTAQWQSLATQLPNYLDADGLAYYFPPRAGQTHEGSDTLTAHLLAATHEAARLRPALALPDAVRAAMERGLIAFVEGRIERHFWSPGKDLDLRKLAAIAALARTGKAQARMLDSLTLTPQQWPTHALIDWLTIVQHVRDVPERAQKLAQAHQLLRSRLQFAGTKLRFANESEDSGWWLMHNADVNSARLLLAVLHDSAWAADLPRLVSGFMARQHNGAWSTTTANLWGALALEQFAALHEATPVKGQTHASLGNARASVQWAKVAPVRTSERQGALQASSAWGAPSAPETFQNNTVLLPWSPDGQASVLHVAHQGSGKPWLTLQTLAAVPRLEPLSAGLSVRKTVRRIDPAAAAAAADTPAHSYQRGDLLRVTLEIESSTDLTWVVITDPIPAGASILGSGLGRDSEIATHDEKREGGVQPTFEERSFEALRSYYNYLPQGRATLQYTLRLHTPGTFQLPPTRAQALYAPEVWGELPNATVTVKR